jgi:L-ascorbate metabolism protein UlaG (beta-lactamase superfamily)
MGPKEAAKACELIRPKVVIPMHYGTFPVLSGKVEDLENEIKKYGLEIKIHPLKPGEEFNL